MKRFLPFRSEEQRKEEISESLIEILASVAMLALGLVSICLGAFVFSGMSGFYVFGAVFVALGAWALGQSLFGLAISASVGMGWFMFAILVVALGFALRSGYLLLVTP